MYILSECIDYFLTYNTIDILHFGYLNVWANKIKSTVRKRWLTNFTFHFLGRNLNYIDGASSYMNLYFYQISLFTSSGIR